MKRFFTLVICFLLAVLFSNSAFCQQNKLEPKWAKYFYRSNPAQFGGFKYITRVDKQENFYVLMDYDTLKIDTNNFVANNRNSTILIKFDSAGNLKWAFNIQDKARRLRSNDFVLDENGNSYITGEYWGEFNISQSIKLDSNKITNQPNLYLTKINNTGKLEWARGFQEGGLASLFIAGIDNIGLKRGSNKTNYQIGDTIIQNFNSYGMATFDKNGNTIATKSIPYWGLSSLGWTITSDKTGNLYALIALKNDSLVIDGQVIKKTNKSKTSFVIARMDNKLNVQWIKNWESALRKTTGTYLYDRELSTDDAGNLYIITQFIDTLSVEGKSVITTDAPKFFIAKVNPTGTLQWLRKSSSLTGNQTASMLDIRGDKLILNASSDENRISFDNFTNITTTAIVALNASTGDATDAFTSPVKGALLIGNKSFYSVVKLTKSNPVTVKGTTYELKGKDDLVIVKMDSTIITGIEKEKKLTNNNSNNISIYPNPASNFVTLYFKEKITTSTKAINITDITGKLIFTKQAVSSSAAEQIKIDVSALPNGIYFIQVQNEKGNFNTQKLMIQR